MKPLTCFLSLLAFLLWGCGQQRQPPAARPEAQRPAAAAPAAPSPGWKIKLGAPQDLPANKPVELTARIQDRAGQPLEGAEVEVSLVMTTMDMGENKARLAPKEPGVYAGKATFTMSGPWEVQVRASKEGATAIEKVSYTVK